MRPVASAPLTPAPNSVRRNPGLCAVVTVALATTFWLGMIWFAGHILS